MADFTFFDELTIEATTSIMSAVKHLKGDRRGGQADRSTIVAAARGRSAAGRCRRPGWPPPDAAAGGGRRPLLGMRDRAAAVGRAGERAESAGHAARDLLYAGAGGRAADIRAGAAPAPSAGA